MSVITDIKCVLSQKAFDAFCEKFYIPEETHPVLPHRGDRMQERPAGKIGLYTRFFDFANFRLPLSAFLVDVLRHFRINISQLFIIGAAKVSYFEILCRVYGIVPTVGLFRCFYVNYKKNGWISFSKRSDNAPVDDFACPIFFPWHTAKNVTRDPAPAVADFNAQDYETLIGHPSLFWKFPEEFLCLVGLSCHYTLDEKTYPQFLHENGEGGQLLAAPFLCFRLRLTALKVNWKQELTGFLRRAVVVTKQNKEIPQVMVGKVLIFSRSLRMRMLLLKMWLLCSQDVKKRKTVVADAGGSLHPPKKLREDYGTPSGPSVAGKSRSAVQRLLAGAVLNAEVRGEAIPTLPFVASSVSATPKHSSHHSGANVANAEVDSLVRSYVLVIATVTTITSTADPDVVVKEKPVKPSLFSTDSSSAGRADPHTGVFSDLTRSDFLVSAIRTVIDPDTDLQKVYVPQWSVTNGSRLDDGRVCREMVDEFAPPKFFASVRGMEHDQLFTKFNVGAARQMSLSAEVRMRAEYNIKEKRRLKSVVDEQSELLKVREREIKSLKAQLLLKEAEAAEAIRLRAKASKFEAVEKSHQDDMKTLKERNTTLEREKNDLDVKVTDLAASVAIREREVADLDTLVTSVKSQNDNLVDRVHELEVSSSGLQEKVTVYENCMGQLEKFQDDRIKEVNDKFDKLYADFIEMALHLEERFYPHLLTTIFGRRWLLTHGMELAISKCLNSPEYLSALGAAIGKAIEKGMQDGLSSGITHGMEGRALTDVAAYNPSAKDGYISALQHLQNVNFSLLAELRSNKDASIDTLMNILRLEETLAERLGLAESQLMVPIYHSPDKVVVGATALIFA
ncbi:hypothetical protein Tco_0883041 [Tanacetum coccineum]